MFFNFQRIFRLVWFSVQQLSFLSLFTPLTTSWCTQSTKLGEHKVRLINSFEILMLTSHLENWISTKMKLEHSVCTQWPVLMLLVSQHGVQSWCHGEQVGDDRPVLETRCALLSCSPGVVWALFVFPFSNGRYPDISDQHCKKVDFQIFWRRMALRLFCDRKSHPSRWNLSFFFLKHLLLVSVYMRFIKNQSETYSSIDAFCLS